jgi:6-phosphogluconolactonase
MTLHIFSSLTALSQSVGTYISQRSAEAIDQRERFTVAISGGSMPKLLSAVTETPIDWSGWHLFWADERCVPLDHPDSNYRLAREYLLDRVAIPPQQIYSLDPALPPEQAAQAYQTKLAQVFNPSASQPPRFDLILLGLGEDGHTASLFPNHPLLQETTLWVAPILNAPKPPPERITLTLPVLNNARHVAFITTGAGKAEILPQILEADAPAEPLPAQRVRPTAGMVDWFVDEAAALQLKQLPPESD